MNFLFEVVGKVSQILAGFAKILIGVMILIVVSDVVVRNLGLRPLSWGVSTSEYILLYATFLPMPWLVRTKGHVFVEFLRNILGRSGRAVLEKVIYLICVGLCLYLGTIALESFISMLQSGDYETRSFDMPKWAVFLPMVVAFYLSALEWLRFLFGFDSMYNLNPLEMEGL